MAPIERIVVLMMENHAFDRVLGWTTALHPGLAGVHPAHPLANPDYPSGPPVFQAPTRARNIAHDPGHDLHNVIRQIDGGANAGFVADYAQLYPQAGRAEREQIMAWYPRGALPGLHALAEQFVVADHWFSSVPGPTWPNRFFAHTGTSLGHVDMPEGIFSPGVHWYDQRTLYDELSDAGVDWRIYYGDVPQSLVLVNQWGHADRYIPLARFAADAQTGSLPSYVFIEPAYFGAAENDQHPPQDVLRGDALIAEVYNALLSDPDAFARTLLVVLYDEHGGFYDHVPPPPTVPPDDNTTAFAFNLLGLRVPAVLISPMLDPGFIAQPFDHTSLLRMAAGQWGAKGVKPLGRRAAQANSPLDFLAWRSTPRTGLAPAPIAPDIQPVQPQPRLVGHKQALFGFSQYLEQLLPEGAAKQQLMARTHEAMGDAMQQSALATDRTEAFLASRRSVPASG